MERIKEIIDLMPGYVSIVNLEGHYIAFNNNLKQLMNINNPEGIKAGLHCSEQSSLIEKLINAPLGTTINWEYQNNNIWLAISSIRNETYIISQAVDITTQKKLEEKLKASERRNKILLKSLPDAVNNSAGRRRNSDLENLVTILTEKPLISQQNDAESLIKLEVELRQNSSRLNNLEKMLYLDESSLKDRINNLETQQENDHKNWQQLENDKESLNQLFQLVNIFKHFPGGAKTWIIILILLQIGITFAIEQIIVRLNFQNTIELIQGE